MARIRTVKPEFWAHPVLCRLPDEVRLAALGLLNFTDDHGYFLAAPGQVRSDLWPLDEDSSKARRVLAHLSAVGYIEVREHPTHGPIGWVVNFSKHQKVDRPSPSRLDTYFLDESSTNPRRILDERSSLDQGSRDQGNEGGEGKREPPPSQPKKIIKPGETVLIRNGRKTGPRQLEEWQAVLTGSQWDGYPMDSRLDALDAVLDRCPEVQFANQAAGQLAAWRKANPPDQAQVVA